tara:strand:- start:4402 stop:4749 length:348 start_codon:yes stop_codon:yes gene_type:complete
MSIFKKLETKPDYDTKYADECTVCNETGYCNQVAVVEISHEALCQSHFDMMKAEMVRAEHKESDEVCDEEEKILEEVGETWGLAKPVIDTPQHLTTEEKILEEVKAIKKILGELK